PWRRCSRSKWCLQSVSHGSLKGGGCHGRDDHDLLVERLEPVWEGTVEADGIARCELHATIANVRLQVTFHDEFTLLARMCKRLILIAEAGRQFDVQH